jgi:predicted N-acyltransferase
MPLYEKYNSQAHVFPILLETIKQLAESIQASSFHCLFPSKTEHDWLQSHQNYSCFDDFLSKLTAAKRKNIRQEHRRVEQAGISFRKLSGYTATDKK